MAVASHKVCTTCGLDKVAEDYYRDKRASHGLCTQCKQCLNERKKAKRNLDPEARRRAWREDYAKYKDRYRKAEKKYAAKNPVARKAYSRHRTHKVRSGDLPHMTGGEFAAWLVAAEKVCHWCRDEIPDSYEVDHVVAFALGGSHTLDNVVISCRSCNSRKRHKTVEEFLNERSA